MRRFFARKGSTPAGAIDRAAQHDHTPRAPRAVEGEASNAPDLPVAAGTKVSRDVPRGVAQARHFNGVDGLRAIAIVAIIAYHARPMLLKGGFLGVTLFLVVSGFFITRSLMNAVDGHRFLLFDYLRRRVKRLWPAVISTIGLTAVLVYACAPPLILKMRGDAVPSALFYSNWSFIFRKLSYFDAAGLPSPLTHLWYTSLIMQFYLLWPLLFIPLFLHCRRHWVRVGVLGAQSGTLGAVFLRVFADDVPGGQRGLKQTIPQAHADVVVCLVPRPCRQDVGNQQRRLRVVRHGPYHCSLEARTPGAFTGWPIVTARVHPANGSTTPLPTHDEAGAGPRVCAPSAPASFICAQFSDTKRSTRASSSPFFSSEIHAISMELRAMRSRSARPRSKRSASAR